MADMEEKMGALSGSYRVGQEIWNKTQVSILLTILGESAQQIYDNMDRENIEKTEKEDINAVLKKLEE